eukprot:Gb_36578 [translate_table: standard]
MDLRRLSETLDRYFAAEAISGHTCLNSCSREAGNKATTISSS